MGRKKKQPDLFGKELYGIAQNVWLSPQEYTDLVGRFGEVDAREHIDAFSEQKGAHGYEYVSDYLAILAWDRNDRKRANNKTGPKNLDGANHGEFDRFVKKGNR